MLPVGTVINVYLSVFVWYSSMAFNFSYNLTKANDLVPVLSVGGISSFKNENYQSIFIILGLNSNIEFEFQCDNKSNTNTFEYKLSWDVLENDESTDLGSLDEENLSLTR